ncbi:MAG: LapA family protein [Chlorobium sp.]|nr:LapA family protein [Chlorobium sp.]
MKLHTIILVLVLFLVLLFAGINWGLFARQDSINFIFFSIEAPLGVIMLGTLGVLSVLYLLFIGRLEVSSMMEERKSNKALQEARELALSKEKSRITELQNTISGQIGAFGERFGTLENKIMGVADKFAGVESKVDDMIARFDEEGVFIVRKEEEGKSGDTGDGAS